MRSYFRLLLVCMLVATLPALFAGFAAWAHNPQGEFVDLETGVWKSDLYEIFAAWWIMSCVFLVVLATCFILIRTVISRWRQRA